jgi:hypothetical protein
VITKAPTLEYGARRNLSATYRHRTVKRCAGPGLSPAVEPTGTRYVLPCSLKECGIDQIAAEMCARWGFALRAAYRHANGLTDTGSDGRSVQCGGQQCRCAHYWQPGPTARSLADLFPLMARGAALSSAGWWDGWPPGTERRGPLVLDRRPAGTLGRHRGDEPSSESGRQSPSCIPTA